MFSCIYITSFFAQLCYFCSSLIILICNHKWPIPILNLIYSKHPTCTQWSLEQLSTILDFSRLLSLLVELIHQISSNSTISLSFHWICFCTYQLLLRSSVVVVVVVVLAQWRHCMMKLYGWYPQVIPHITVYGRENWAIYAFGPAKFRSTS